MNSQHLRQNRQASLWSRIIAGALGGLLLSIALTGIYGWYSTDGMSDRYMLLLWWFIPIWVAAFCFSIWCRRALQAWLVLLTLNVLSWTGLYGLQQLHGQ